MMEYIQKTYGGIGMKNNKKILMFSSILILLFICIAFVGREFQNALLKREPENWKN